MTSSETLRERIKALKKEKNAVILAHNYQSAEVQDCADYTGDSFELAVRALTETAEMIVFAGVLFMAETAKILNPSKKVILPSQDARCPLADFLTPKMIDEARRDNPGAAVVVYINSTAECKAHADIVCTSANAVEVVRSLSEHNVIFGPDSNLADYVASFVPEKRIIPLPAAGHCYVHSLFTAEDVVRAKIRGKMTVCHPECPRAIRDEADCVASTGGMVRLADRSDEWMIFTEKDMAYRLKTLFPEKSFAAPEEAVCADMKKTTLPLLIRALEKEEYEIQLPGPVMDGARGALERMLELRKKA